MRTLTERQMEVVEMMVNGVSNNEMAKKLGIGRQRVKELKQEVRSRMGFKYGENIETAVARYTEWYHNAGPL
jgi:DNA-binding NarL/FixJ family response regulator